MKKRIKKRGGKRPGAGRPRLPNARTSVFSVPVSTTEKEFLAKKKAITWARELLLKEAEKK